MKLITVKMPEIYVRGIEELVKAGLYSSRSEVIRIAVRELLKRELWGATIPKPAVHDTTAIPNLQDEPLQAPGFAAPGWRSAVEVDFAEA